MDIVVGKGLRYWGGSAHQIVPQEAYRDGWAKTVDL